jgi:H/ACA ribonucleoprotein complex subunit 4
MPLITRLPDAQTNPKFGKAPRERTWQELVHSGVVVIDKPAGPTSHQVSAYVQKILGIGKAGHSGTLDPQVTGVLVTGLGDATKAVHHLLTSGKQYVCVMHLHKPVEEYQLRKVLADFTGRIKQLPPVKSAVKRVVRERTVYDVTVIEIDGQEVLFSMDCQAGTYVRKFCHDIGQALGCGAHMAALRRTRVAHFTEKEAVTLQTLTDAFVEAQNGSPESLLRMLRPVEDAVSHLPAIIIQDSAINALTHGVQLKVPGIVSYDESIRRGQPVALYSMKGELVATATAQMDAAQMGGTGGLATKTERVYLSSDVYPRMQ